MNSPPRFNNGPQEPETPFSTLLDDSSSPSEDQDAALLPEPAASPQPTNSASSGDDKPADKTGSSNDNDQSASVQNAATQAGGNQTCADQAAIINGKLAGCQASAQCKLDSDVKSSGDSKSDDGKETGKTAEACKTADAATAQAIVAPAATALAAVAPAVVVAPSVTVTVAPAAPADAKVVTDDGVDAGTAAVAALGPLKDVSTSKGNSGKTPANAAPADAAKTIDPATPDNAQAINAPGNDKQTPPGDTAGKDNLAKDAPAHASADGGATVHHDLAQLDAPAPPGPGANSAGNPDPAQTQQINLPPPAAAANQAAPGATLTQAAPIPVAGLAVEIAGRALAGKNHFEIRLDPPELGRIDVHLNVDRDGQVTSHLVVDRADTLDLLRRDSTGLERALQDAGLKTSDNGLQFSLRDQSTNQNGNTNTNIAPNVIRAIVPDDTMPATVSTQRIYSRIAGMGGGLDIRV